MTETEEREQEEKGKPLGLSRPGKLELKKTVETGQVRQSFSHGRSKMVQVEVRKKRTFAPDAGGRMAEVKAQPSAAVAEVFEPQTTEAETVYGEAPGRRPGPGHLTTEEKAARARALEGAKKGPDDNEVLAPVDPETAARTAAEEVRAAEEASRKAAEEADARRVTEEETRRKVEEQAKAAAAAAALKLQAHEEEETDEDRKGAVKRHGRVEPRRPGAGVRRNEPRRRSTKLTIAAALTDDEERMRSLASVKRQRERERLKQLQQEPAEIQKFARDVVVPETITVQELANRMAERGAAVIKSLMNMGVMATITQTIDADTAELVVREFGHNVRRVSESDVEIGLRQDADEDAFRTTRPPVVTIMGHVDHGKTSLLDALRETDVAAHEAGGITQHIGAYQVTMRSGAKISFIDTPGHAAFTEMRARGARLTDIVVLVVAADDGVMPQTVEAIHHAKAAEVPIIVAINKIDKPDANPQRIKQELLQHALVGEEMGGEVLFVEVSAKEKVNLEKLEETILLQAEILDLRANPNRPAEGTIVEAKMTQGRGSVATVLVQRGTLKVGDVFVAGPEWGRVRALFDAHGQSLNEAGPGTPAEIVGLTGTPAAGDDFVVLDSEGRAREISEFRQRRQRNVKAASVSRGTLEQMMEKIKQGEGEILPVIVKADVHGSVEAIQGAIEKISTDEVKVNVLHTGVGAINESDVTLGRASGAVIIGFNVRANPQARELARRDGVEIRYYSIIYDVTEDMKKALTGLLKPELKENIIGYAEIRQVFSISKVGKVAGCMVTEGVVKRGAKVRLLRDNVVIHEGDLSQLKRFKDDAREVKQGLECGMTFANYQDIREGDMVECFEIQEISRAL